MYTITQIIGFLVIIAAVWIGVEMWRAPLLEQQEDGSWKTIKPTKKLSNLFKRKK